MWGRQLMMQTCIRTTYVTYMHPDTILIEPLGQMENPRAYVSRAHQHQMWRNVTGNDQDLSQMERSILQAKLQDGLPVLVKSTLAR